MKHHEIMLLGLIQIAEGLVMLLSLGFLNPSWDIDFCFYCVQRGLKRKKPVVLAKEDIK